jgi:hypothetical protein
MDTARLIEITARGDNNDSRSVRIYNERRMTQVLPFGDQAIAPPSKPQIGSEWLRSSGVRQHGGVSRLERASFKLLHADRRHFLRRRYRACKGFDAGDAARK